MSAIDRSQPRETLEELRARLGARAGGAGQCPGRGGCDRRRGIRGPPDLHRRQCRPAVPDDRGGDGARRARAHPRG